jgi:hypothetical protein
MYGYTSLKPKTTGRHDSTPRHRTNQPIQFLRPIPERQGRLQRHIVSGQVELRLFRPQVPSDSMQAHPRRPSCQVRVRIKSALFPRAMGGTEMTNCPECSSANTENLLAMRDDRQDNQTLTITKYKCKNCGCQFETREHWEIQVTRSGKA